MSDLNKKLEEVHLGDGRSQYFIDIDGNLYWQYQSRLEIISGRVTGNGYRAFQIGNKLHLAHRIVAQAFIPNPDNKPCVNHKDGNKLNNSSSNLEWVTYSENMRHAFDTGIYESRKGSKQNNAKLTEAIVAVIKRELDDGATGTSLAKKYGVAHGRIYDIKHGRAWTHVAAKKASGIE